MRVEHAAWSDLRESATGARSDLREGSTGYIDLIPPPPSPLPRAGGGGPRTWRVCAQVCLSALFLAVVVVLVLGCASVGRESVERMGRGPRAEEIYLARSIGASGRQPTFDEKRMWEDRLDERMTKYRRDHPEIEQSHRYTDVRFWRQVAQGAPRDEVRALLEDPEEQTIDPALMGALAEQHWAAIGPKTREAWVYPLGWVIFFDDAGAVDFVRRGRGAMESLD